MFDGCNLGVESWYLGYATVDILFLLSVFSQTFFLYLFVSFCYIFFLVVAPTVDSFSMFFHVFHAIAEKQ